MAVAALLAAGCAGLDQQVSTQPVDPATGMPVGPPAPAVDEGGDPVTVGDTIAETLGGAAPVITGTATALGGTMAGILAAGLVAYGVGSLRNRRRAAAPPPA